ncbi:MAG: cation-translocating P-type ATPase [Thiohalocapsa sp.]|jgi:Ca2+-transporting ATPase|uniref:cation-translocating P-type ATPase n=1 Tax=Thiohalocapsa sp. TaxID=2497641 RepID=UPI0025D003FE|nr:cation-translocating P-type ATPase [Thiohalocapsa sp.]MCG6943529.1 cation-translocating P-type ATPase [Thiohalocapsa sp.]
MPNQHLWHMRDVDDIGAELGTGANGLGAAEAAARLGRYGYNELPRADAVSPWKILAEQFQNVLIIILLIAVGLSAVLGEVLESVVIAVIVLFAIGLGFIQEYRAERAMEALRKMAAPNAKVIRDGREQTVPAREVVPGDLVLLGAGDRIPADLRLTEAVNLRVNEAALTGESVPVDKSTDALAEADLALGDRVNLAYAGTDVAYGRGRGIAVETGLGTEFGRVTGMLAGVEQLRTPLQQNLDKVGRVLAIAAGVVVVLIAGLGVLRGENILDMFIFGVALAVAVVPEALPAVVTISLAIGVQQMVKRHALVRRLPTVETLGSTSVICSDKTGTLTRDEMTVRAIWTDGQVTRVTGSGYAPEGDIELPSKTPEQRALVERTLHAAALSCDAHLEQEDGAWRLYGDPTEGALVVAAAKAGIVKSDLEAQKPRFDEIPFSSERKRMTTLHRDGDGTVAYAKGAAEVILAGCDRLLTLQEGAPRETPLDGAARAQIEQAAGELAQQALRVLAIAEKPGAGREDGEHHMIFLGLVGMIDPPRDEARPAIADCERAGIRPIMITGDHPDTAAAIARELGILRDGRVVAGRELDAMSQQELDAAVADIEVYARVSPEHKLRVVKAWQRRGHVCAMTGDGVNDAPALKRADIGIAMGITGTDVSREAADMTLTDDNFASIVGAVEEGRGIFSNIKKYLMYLLSSNIGEIGLMAAATLAGLPLPLSAVQILYVNLATDGLPALALAVDPPEPGLMRRPPRDPKAGIFTPPVVWLMVIGGVWSTIVNVSLFVYELGNGERMGLDPEQTLVHAMTTTFISLVLIQFFKAYNFRSDRDSVLRHPFANRWLNIAILWELMLLALIVYVPVLSDAFGTYALPLSDWLLVLGAALTIVPVLEITKWLIRRLAPLEPVGDVHAPARIS